MKFKPRRKESEEVPTNNRELMRKKGVRCISLRLCAYSCKKSPAVLGIPPEEEDIDPEDRRDIADMLSREMMANLEMEKKAIRNWKKIGLRVQMVTAFKLSLKGEEEEASDKD